MNLIEATNYFLEDEGYVSQDTNLLSFILQNKRKTDIVLMALSKFVNTNNKDALNTSDIKYLMEWPFDPIPPKLYRGMHFESVDAKDEMLESNILKPKSKFVSFTIDYNRAERFAKDEFYEGHTKQPIGVVVETEHPKEYIPIYQIVDIADKLGQYGKGLIGHSKDKEVLVFDYPIPVKTIKVFESFSGENK